MNNLHTFLSPDANGAPEKRDRVRILEAGSKPETPHRDSELFSFSNQFPFAAESPHLRGKSPTVYAPKDLHEMSLSAADFEMVNKICELDGGHCYSLE
jgi:hypothetical protein